MTTTTFEKAYAVIVDPFGPRPSYWTGGTMSDDRADLGGFTLEACERAARDLRSRTHGGGGYSIHWRYTVELTYPNVTIVEVEADRFGNCRFE